jgi:hypothetical protein
MKRYEVKVGATGVSCNSETESEFNLVKVKNNNEFIFNEDDLVNIEENIVDFSKIYSFNVWDRDLMFRVCDLELCFEEK